MAPRIYNEEDLGENAFTFVGEKKKKRKTISKLIT